MNLKDLLKSDNLPREDLQFILPESTLVTILTNLQISEMILNNKLITIQEHFAY